MPSVADLIQSGGLLLIALIVFGESGMFLGFFFPGDTLLLTAGVFAAQGKLSLTAVILVVAVAAIAGDNTGYHIGRRYGRRLFKKPDSIVFRQEYVHKAEHFFERFGAKTMLFAHFVPIVRTFAPPVAGVANMDRKKFIIFDAIGDIGWAVIVTMIGYWFGTKIPNIDSYILLAVAAAMTITLGPSVYHFYQAVRRNRNKKSSSASGKPPELNR